jgi:5-methylthioadenosine/S-adenosylhomocysteine deaminase
MATMGGAEVLGLDAEIGSLTLGKKADLQLIDPAAVNFAPKLDWISQLVFNAQPANVSWVFVSGRALKRHGHVVGDQSQVIADAQAASDRVQKLLAHGSGAGSGALR